MKLKYIKRFFQIIIALILIYLSVYFSTFSVNAQTLSRTLDSYAQLKVLQGDSSVISRNPSSENSYIVIENMDNLFYIYNGLNLMGSVGPNSTRITDILINSYVLTSQCSNNCDIPILFNLVWESRESYGTQGSYYLQNDIAWILNNYNKVYIVFTDNNDKVWRTKLNTRVLQSNQSNDDTNNIYDYYLNIEYTLTLYNVKHIDYIDIYFPDSAFQEQLDFYNNNNGRLMTSTRLLFNSLDYAYESYSGGSNGTDGTDNSQQQIQDLQQQTNQNLSDIRLQMLSEESPDTMGLANSAGWLPTGPIDSLVNLPLTFLSNLNTSLGSSCSPISVPLPFVNQNATLPCISSMVSEMGSTAVNWWNGVGLIASAIILYKYLMHLFKWVGDTLSLKDNNNDWGGV